MTKKICCDILHATCDIILGGLVHLKPNNSLYRLDTSNLSSRVYESLLTAIVRQEFKAGQILDIESLADTFGVSRTPIQTAVARLATLGLIEIRPRKGTFIAKLTEEDVHDLFEIRALIEVHSAKKAAILATDDALHALNELVEKSEEHFNADQYTDYYEFLEFDRQFHSMIVKLGKNRRLVSMYNQNRTLIELMRVSASRHTAGANLTRKRHIAITNALVKRDGQKAAEFVEKHIKESERTILERLHLPLE